MKRLLLTAAAAAVALTAIGTVAPASAAALAPAAPSAAATQTADTLLVEVKHGGKRGGFKRHGKRFGFKHYHGGYYPYGYSVSNCWTTEKVWTQHGWRWQQVYNCY